MKNLNWDDLQAFLSVAAHKGLTGAAAETKLSPATLGRRMIRLEERAGQALFERSQKGYSLTEAGQLLFHRANQMKEAAIAAETLLDQRAETPVIRLSAGTGTTQFLIAHYKALVRPEDAFTLSFNSTEAIANIAHRETDLGIRNQAPTGLNLASRPLGQVAFAPFCSRDADPNTLDWVALESAAARHPASQWIHDQIAPISATTQSVASLQALILHGVGKGIMPCMIGDGDPRFKRAGDVISGLTETQFLVTHNDDRHRPPLRRLSDRLAQIWQKNASLLAGQSPIDPA